MKSARPVGVIRKVLRYWFIVLPVIAVFAGPAWWYSDAGREENDPDLPAGVKLDKGAYLQAREEQIAMIRGLDTAKQGSRTEAIIEMERAEVAHRAASPSAVPVPKWKPMGPAPIPNGQTQGRTDPVSGRMTSLAVDPTDPNIVYAGSAGGGLFRTMDGGMTWTPMMDNALTLAIGSVAIAPSDPSIVYVGTGEGGFSLDAFFGVGIYRINGANTDNPTLTGPLNRDAANADVFTGRSVSAIAIHPTNPAIIYAASVTGTAGLGSTIGFSFPNAGLYRSTNATSAAPTFERLIVSTTGPSRPILDAVFEPGNPDRMFVTLVDTNSAGDGGVYFSTNAQAANPTFSRLPTLVTAATAELGRAELAIQKTGNTVTVYCAHGTGTGRLSVATYQSDNPGTPAFTTHTTGGSQNFCSGQCFYDIAVAVDPTNGQRVYLGGSPTVVFGYSSNGGTTLTESDAGLHVDTHAIAVAPSQPSTIYFASDGGVWRSADSGLSWTSLNNSGLNTTQFQSVAVHPNERYHTIGGTQDNGTIYLFPNGTTLTRSVGGDGGFVAYDTSSNSATSVVSYHTFFNRTNTQIGFARSTTTQANGNPIYGGLLGCVNGNSNNGIACADNVLFYAPMVVGPDAPGSTGNTVYFGTTRLWRSINRGTTMTAVSDQLPARISAIGIAPSTDAVRLVGTTAGGVYRSSTLDATTMTDITGTLPARYVGRIAVHPTDPNVAYVAFGGFGIPGRHVMKTSNLLATNPTWTDAGSGIPDVPANGLVIDPASPNTLYAGTDIGVFKTTDGGANWVPFNEGLPRVAVFEIVMQPGTRNLKIATHGKGIWEYSLNPRPRADFDGDGRSDVSLFRPGTSAAFWFAPSAAANFVSFFGTTGDVPVPGDYDGDGKADVAIFRGTAETGNPDIDFYVLQSSTGAAFGISWGLPGDIPTTGDYDGDGKADFSVWRPSNQQWFIAFSGGGFMSKNFGSPGDKPMGMDPDGNGITNPVIFRDGLWFVADENGPDIYPVYYVVGWGAPGDLPVPADYDGDNKDDFAIFRPSTGAWWIQLSTGGVSVIPFSTMQPGVVPVPGDYDGDGKDDVAFFVNGSWFASRSSAGPLRVDFGDPNDVPVASKYLP